MTGGRRGVALTPMEVRRDVIVRAAVLADELGYELFSVAEGWGLDSSVLLAELACRTEQIRLMAGVLSVWGRTPGTLAMTAATLHEISGGRFVLGLGVSTRQLVEGWHDVAFADPAGQLRQVTSRVRALLAGERPEPTAVPGARALRLGRTPVPDLPIWVAATGPRTMRVVADLADGWYPLYLRRDHLRARADEIARLRAAGRELRPLTVGAGPFTVVDPDVAAARAAAAEATAWYLTTMGEVYPRLVASQGLSRPVGLVRAANPAGGRGRGTVPAEAEDLLAEFTAYGTADSVAERLRSWDEAVDITMVGLPPGLPWPRIEATLHAAAPVRAAAAS